MWDARRLAIRFLRHTRPVSPSRTRTYSAQFGGIIDPTLPLRRRTAGAFGRWIKCATPTQIISIRTKVEKARQSIKTGRNIPSIHLKSTRITRQDLPVQVQRIPRIPRRVALILHTVILARLDLIFRNRDVMQMIRRFHERGHQTRSDVIFDMAMKQPHARIIGAESPHRVAVLVEHDGVATDGRGRNVGGVGAGPSPRVRPRALEHLVLVSVEMHGVQIFVFVVDDEFDDFAVFEDGGVGIFAIHERVRAVVPHGQGGVQRGYFLRQVGDVVDGEAGDAVDGGAREVHGYASTYGFEEGLLVVGFEGYVVEEVEGVEGFLGWEGFGFVVDEPGCGVAVPAWDGWSAGRGEQHVHVESGEDDEILAGVVFGCD